jgi:hypothetical protein
MRSLMILVALVAFTVVSAGSAAAFQCPKLVAQIDGLAGNRFDDTAWRARNLAAEGKKLHTEGKHPEAEKKGIEGLALMGVKVEPTHK